MKTLLTLSLLLMVVALSPANAIANEEVDEAVLWSEETTDDVAEAEEFTDAWGSKHLGCVNSASSCKRRAYQHGYNHSRIQQDFYCPKTIYSCYGWLGED